MIKSRRRSAVTAFIAKNQIVISFPFNQDHVNIVKAMMGAKWNRHERVWTLYSTTQNKKELLQIFPDLNIIDKDSETIAQTEKTFADANKRFLPKNRKITIKDFVFKTKPMNHQKITFNFLRGFDCAANLLEQGLGKSKVLIDVATWRFRMGQIKICFITAPTTVVGAFADEIEKHGHDDFNDLLILDDKSTKKRQQRLEELLEKIERGEQFHGFIITNHDALGSTKQGLRQYLIKANAKRKLFQMMAVDESSKIKHASSQRSKSHWKVGQTVKYRQILTGTFITQGAEDAFGQYRFLDDRVFGTMVSAFRGTYIILGGFEGREVVGYSNINEFLNKIYAIGIRFTKEICLDLPKKIYRRRVIRLDDKVSKLYREVEREAVSEWDGETIIAPLAINRMTKAAQIAAGFIYTHDETGKKIGVKRIHNLKTDAVKEELDDHDGKVIIWTSLEESQVMAREMMAKNKIKFVEVTAADSMPERRKKVKQFNEDESIKAFLSKPTLAGLGLTMNVAHHVIYIVNSHNAEDRWQSEDRNHRYGQESPVTYCDIVAVTAQGGKTYDHDALKTLSNKKAFANVISSGLIARMAARHPDIVAAKDKKTREKIKAAIDDMMDEEEF